MRGQIKTFQYFAWLAKIKALEGDIKGRSFYAESKFRKMPTVVDKRVKVAEIDFGSASKSCSQVLECMITRNSLLHIVQWVYVIQLTREGERRVSGDWKLDQSGWGGQILQENSGLLPTRGLDRRVCNSSSRKLTLW